MKVQILTRGGEAALHGLWLQVACRIPTMSLLILPRLGAGRRRKRAHSVDACRTGVASLLLSSVESPARLALRPLL